ncbi:MAG: sugar transferase [Paludibacteraceae bacterium]|nr:sugar transferase [Paludibacteraceae bacterium]
MLKNRKSQLTAQYILVDIAASLFAWFLFFVFRRLEIESSFIQEIQLFSPIYNFEKLLVGIPVFWVSIFWISGYYNEPFNRSRLTEFLQTLFCTFCGSVILFFVLLLNDPVVSYYDYYKSFVVLFLITFLVIYIARYAITSTVTYNVHNRIIGFNTIIIGTENNALNIYNQLQGLKRSTGHKIIGFVSLPEEMHTAVKADLILGDMPKIDLIIKNNNIEEVIVAIDSDDEKSLFKIINNLYKYNINIKFTPQLYDYLVGGITLSNIYAAPLVNVLANKMPYWQQNCKRLGDIFCSALFFIVGWPLMLYLALRVKRSSDGPIFYKQERIGLHGKPFNIIKFRTMYVSQKTNTPKLASENDSRITPFGKVMRKYRLDELPQFFNVLKGDMSLVGPRPEQKFFIDKIIEKAPYYSLVHKVKPGITSWGMVMYGYADTVDKMIERLKFDIIYLENISLKIDLKILIYTILTIVKGKGV